VALGTELRRTSKVTVHFYPEVNLG